VVCVVFCLEICVGAFLTNLVGGFYCFELCDNVKVNKTAVIFLFKTDWIKISLYSYKNNRKLEALNE